MCPLRVVMASLSLPCKAREDSNSPPRLPSFCRRRVQKEQEITRPVSPCAEQAVVQKAQRPLPALGQPHSALGCEDVLAKVTPSSPVWASPPVSTLLLLAAEIHELPDEMNFRCIHRVIPHSSSPLHSSNKAPLHVAPTICYGSA